MDVQTTANKEDAWNRYYTEFDTDDARNRLMEKLLDHFEWEGAERNDRDSAKTAVRGFVMFLRSAAFIALDRGMDNRDVPPFETWMSEQEADGPDPDDARDRRLDERYEA